MSDYTLNIVKAGWLFRLSDILKNWKKEWAIINTNGEMNFFKAPNKLVSLKKINLGIECHEILSYDECKHRLPDCTGEKCVFGFSNSDEYWFCAESEDDAIVWRLTIEQLMSLPPEPYRPAPLPPYTPAPPYGAPNAYYYQTPYPMNQPVIHGGSGNVVLPQTVVQHPNGTQTVYVNGGVPYCHHHNCAVSHCHDYHCGDHYGDAALGMMAGATAGALLFSPFMWSPFF